VKTFLLCFIVLAVGLASAQVPPAASQNIEELKRQALLQVAQSGTNLAPTAIPIAAAGISASPTNANAGQNIRTTPRPTAPLPRNSIVIPNSAGTSPLSGILTPTNAPATNAAGDLIITPSATATNLAAEELIPAGMIDFRGIDLQNVLNVYSDLVNKTILRPAALTEAKIWLTTKTALTKTEAKQALDAVLALNGIVIVSINDKFVKAAQLTVAGALGAPFNTQDGGELPNLGQYITHLVQLRYVKPSDMVQVLQPYASGVANGILPIDPSQILVLRDLTENVKRMLELIREIDVSVPSEFVSEVIPIKYAKATEIASALNSLSSGGGGGTTVGSTGSGSGSRTTSRSSSFGRSGNSGFGTGGMGGAGYPGGMNQGMGQPLTTPQGATTPSTGTTFGDRLRTLMKGAAGTGEIVVFGQTKMIADERTNSLLIYASRDDMRIIKEIIAKLDIVLAQVLIETVIIEVDLSNDRNIGVSYLQHPQTSGKFTGVGAINNGNFLTPGNFVLGGGTNGASSGGMPGGFSYLTTIGGDLDIAVTAVADNSRAKVLQRPRIQTSHNEPATIFVGESRPYPTASYYGGGAYGGYSSIQQLQIGVTLEVTPLINPDGLVVMDIHQTIESANGTVNLPNVGEVPITSRKEASAKVSVRDHDTIILGGLIETSKSKSASGVPFLKDIPLLGYAFRSSSDKEVRNELIVLIRPTVLPTPEVAAMAAKAEQNNMPGVRQAEKEIRDEEAKRAKKAEKDINKRQDGPGY
jgi:general secretion pathway protein D